MSVRRILLVQPPYTIYKSEPKGCQPPLGLAYMAAVLERENYEVKILDAVAEGYDIETGNGSGLIRYGLGYDEIERIMEEYSPDIVGISCLFSSQHKNAMHIAKIAGKLTKLPTIVMGGAHPTSAYSDVLGEDLVDYVILGEGDHSFRDLIRALDSQLGLENVDGLAYKNKEGVTVVNPKRKFIENLDELPLPARHLLPMTKYFDINRPHGTTSIKQPNTSLITSRGCPANCIFCSIHSVWGRSFRSRSVDNIMLEIKHLIKAYGIRELHFEDDNLTFNKNRAKELFRRMVQEGVDLSWTTPNGIAAYAIDDELVGLMKKSGCYRVCLAVESGDQHVLTRIIKKPLKLDKIKPLISKFRKEKIAVDGFFVVGFPDETAAQIRNTFKFAARMDFDNVNFFLATPYPGTELFKICENNGYLDEFSYERLKVGNGNISTSVFKAKELERLVAKETFKFKLKQLKSPVKFYNRIIKRFFIDPRFFISNLKKLFFRIAGSN